MKLLQNIALSALLCTAAAAPQALAQGTTDPAPFRRALELYDGGMYAEARAAFEAIPGDYIAEGYAALSAVAMRAGDADEAAGRYLESHPFSTLCPQIVFRQAQNAFADGNYEAALALTSRISEDALEPSQRSEYRFNRAFSAFSNGAYAQAEPLFRQLAEGPMTDYTAPSRYCLGYISYDARDFKTARGWFSESVKDPRFEDISSYYLVECAFMEKDYRYVVEKGPLLAEAAPADRQSHLSRMISEAYLILGDTEGAEAYYRKTLADNPARTRGDFFFAGSVLYAVGDYRGAAENFSKMSTRTDSLGQIASYQLANSYIKIKDKVSALEAFREASEVSFDPAITEDAFFNYAKLSFDLNHNPTPFRDYLERYPDKEKNDQIWQYVALAALYSNDYQGAIDAYDNIDSLDPRTKANYVKANYLRAHQLIGGGAWRTAIQNLRAVDFYSDRGETVNQLGRYWLAQAYYQDGQYDRGAKELTALYALSALDGQPEGVRIPYDLAYTYFRAGNYAEAARWFDNYLRDPSAASREDALIRRADCDFFSKDYRSAISRYDEILAGGISPNNIYPYLQDAIACGLTGQDAKKMKLLGNVLEADPSAEYYDEALYELGSTCFVKKEYDTAVRVFKQLRSTSSDPTVQARALLQLGMVYNRMDDPRKALAAFKEVVSTQPGTPQAESALLAIESVYRDLGQPELYLDYAASVGQAPDMTPAEKESLYFRSAAQVFDTGNYAGALSSFESFKTRFPESRLIGHADFYIAECYRLSGRNELARDFYSRSVDEGDDQEYVVTAMRRYSDLSFAMEQYKDAYNGYRALFDLGDDPDGSLPPQEYALGMLRSAFKAKLYDKAVQAAGFVRQYSDIAPDVEREVLWMEAQSNLGTNRRAEAYAIYRTLAEDPSTDEGAEAACMLIQDVYDQGRFEEVYAMVVKHFSSGEAPEYWTARAYIILGDSYADLDNYKQARATFESIRASYTPNAGDDIVPTVEARLRQLSEINK